MKIKVITCLSIFAFLFVCAWFINEETKRVYIKTVINDTETIGDYLFSPTKVEADTWNFKSREYIKVRKLNK